MRPSKFSRGPSRVSRPNYYVLCIRFFFFFFFFLSDRFIGSGSSADRIPNETEGEVEGRRWADE